MKYLWYGFLGLFSLGFLGLLVAVAGFAYVLNYYGHDLPDYEKLKDYQPPIVTRLYAGDGRLLAEFAQEKRVFVPIENIPDRVKQAFIAMEDKNFYTHKGVDFTAILRAVFTNIQHLGSGRRPVGASTITQQVAKNFLLTNEVSYERKIKEAILANRMERAMTKDQLLELYLNEIYLGARSYGVAAAGLEYFNKSLEELSIAEAAYLAALPKAPNNYHPIRNHDAAVSRRNDVISRMLEDGYITEGQADLAKITPLDTVLKDNERTARAPFFAEEVRRQLSDRYGQESLYQGGLAVRTTIDPQLQDYAEKALRGGLMEYDQRHGYRGPVKHFKLVSGWKEALESVERLPGMLENWELAFVLEVSSDKTRIGLSDGLQGSIALKDLKWARKYMNEGYAQGPEITAASEVVEPGDVVIVEPLDDKRTQYALRQVPDVQGALIALDPHTGRILAMQGGWKYGTSEFNRATQAKRQPGSAFKPFVYLAALESGFTPATLVLDAPFVIEDRPGHFWSPTNYSNEYYGPTPIRVGVEKSKNLMTVRLADYLGTEKIAEVSKRFGIDPNMQLHLANALGAGETTLLNLTSAYGVLVNGGKKITPSFVDRIQDRRGQTIFRHDDRQCVNCGALIRWDGQMAPELPDPRQQLTDPRTAYQMVSILEGVIQRGTGIKLKELDRPLAGKTGTTNASKDTWFIGFSPDLVVGAFVGFDEPRSLGKRETGASAALPVFKEFMEDALKDQPIIPFRIPNGIRNVQINADTGARAVGGEENVIWEAFVVGTEPTEDTYILDASGINLFSGITEGYTDFGVPAQNYRAYDDYQGSYTPPQNTYMPQQQPYQPPSQPAPSSSTEGTGGLY